jgi:hypothetical protein
MTHSRSLGRALTCTGLLALIACSSGGSGGSRGDSQGGGAGISGGNDSSSGGTSNNNGGASNASGGSLIGFAGSTGSSGQGAGGDTCAATSISAKLIPLDLYVIMDSSKSMLEPTASGSTKWKATTDALKAFFTDQNSEGLGVALKFFPDEQAVPATCSADTDCKDFGPCDQRKSCVAKGTYTKVVTTNTLCKTDADCTGANETCAVVQRCADGANCAKVYCVSGGTGTAECPSDCMPFTGYCRERDVCSAGNYAMPAVDFRTLPDPSGSLGAALDARMPDGYTPTGPALTGALQQARARAKANPGHKVAVILVTDGLPGGFLPQNPPASCMPGDITGVANVAAMGNMASADGPAIQTFVIGVFGPCDLIDQNVMPEANLTKLASSGGTNKAVIVKTDQNVQQQLQDALKQARSSAIACQYEMPTSDTGTVDTGKVNVKFSSSSTGAKTILYVATKDKCDPTNGGWYYDQDPATGGKPTQIIVCDQSCSTFQSIQDGRVDIALGCKTEVPL